MATEINILHGLVHSRITNLLAVRQLYRSIYKAEWPPRRHAVEIELRALLALARQARQTAAAEPDPIDLAKAANEQGYLGYHDWSAR